jgi:hypothetical protein
MRIRNVLIFLVILSLPVLAGPKHFTAGAGKIKGKPTIEAGKQNGYFIWQDKEGLHLRWTAAEKTLLYTGRIDLDKPLKEMSRIKENAGGWAKPHGNRIVLFSSTVRPNDIDGIDLKIPGGRKAQLMIDIDGKPPTVEQVFLGEKSTNPKGLPLRLLLR